MVSHEREIYSFFFLFFFFEQEREIYDLHKLLCFTIEDAKSTHLVINESM